MGKISHVQASNYGPRKRYQSTLHCIPCPPLQESPEENSAYEQLLSHLEEIAEEGQFVACPRDCTPENGDMEGVEGELALRLVITVEVMSNQWE